MPQEIPEKEAESEREKEEEQRKSWPLWVGRGVWHEALREGRMVTALIAEILTLQPRALRGVSC